MIVTMYLPNVYMRHQRGSGLAARTIRFSLDDARHHLDLERVRGAQSPLEWKPILRHEKDGIQAHAGELTYEVLPVDVDISIPALSEMKMKLEKVSGG